MTNKTREAFEVWVERATDEPTSPTHVNGDYSNLEDQAAWQAWQHQQARIDEVLNANERLGKSNEKLCERIAELEAHVASINKAWSEMTTSRADSYDPVVNLFVLRDAMNKLPEHSLARIRAEAKAQALQGLLDNEATHDWEGNACVWQEDVEKQRDKYRAQAKEGE